MIKIITENKQEFASLHNHSFDSLQDATMSPEQVIQQAHDLGFSAVALTEHGNCYSFINAYKKAQELGIKYIAGCEVYETSDIDYKTVDSDRYHLILLAQNEVGLRNLFKIVTEGNTRGFYTKPRVDIEVLRKYSEGIICMSSCLGGMVNKTLGWKENEETTPLRWSTAKWLVERYKSVFGSNFYLEMQSHDTEAQRRANQQLVQLARMTDTKLTITFDTHLRDGSKIQRDAHALFIQTSQNRKIEDEDAYTRLKDTYKGCWQQDVETIHVTMDEQVGRAIVDEAIKNTFELAQGCDTEIKLHQHLMPHIEIPKEFSTEQDYLKHLVNEGWIRRGFNKFSKEKQKIYAKRLQDEFEILDYLGYCGYFIMLKQLIGKMKERKIPLGYSRGSGGNVLTLYTIGVTEIDSIKWNLDFSRFGNKGRLGSSADYDIDMSQRRRQEVLEIAAELFGEDHISQVATFNSMSPKVCIRDLGKVLDENGTYTIPYSLRDKISKLIPEDPNEKMTIERALESSLELRKYEKQFPLLFEYTKHLQNIPKSVGCHAAAVLIAPQPIVDFCPLQYNKNGNLMAQLEMHNVMDDIGLVKMDFLGLVTVDVVQDALDLAGLTKDDINLATMDLDDKEVFENIYGKGNTLGIFQMESFVAQRMFSDMMPDVSIEDVFAVNAMNRPAILSVGMDRVYIHNKKHPEDTKLIHPELDSIFGVTNGIMLFQEQALQVFRLAGFPEQEVDNARRAIGKKKIEVMKKLKQSFDVGLINREWVQEQVDELWNLVEAQSSYSFNRGHSVAYGLLSYVTAWLKYHYPVEFMTALLISEMGNYDQLTKYINECREMKIEILPPDINKSGRLFSIDNGRILFGLQGVKGVGESSVDAILEERRMGDFHSFNDFISRVRLDSRSVTSLIQSGCFGMNRDELLYEYAKSLFEYKPYKPVKTLPTMKILLENDIIRTYDEFKNKEICLERWNEHKRVIHENHQREKYDKHISEFEDKYMSVPEMYEFSTLSIFLTSNPFEGYEQFFKPLEEAEDKKKFLLGGTVAKIKYKKQKNGGKMAYIDLLTQYGIIECIVFAQTYTNYQDYIKKGENIVVLAKKSGEQFVIDKIKDLSSWKEEKQKEME